MAKLVWDAVGQRFYETGVDRGVLYVPDAAGVYNTGYVWNGLTAITESPSGGEASPQYADNIKYLNMESAEDFTATLEAFTYPPEFAQCDGSAELFAGVSVGQQGRKTFGLAYRTRVGNDTEGADFGYKIHLVYGATAAPSEKAYTTINDSPEAMGLSWELTTTAVEVGTVGGKEYKPTANLVVDSTKVDAGALATLEDALYGTAGTEPRLPLPAEVYAMFAGTVTEVQPVEPSYDSATDTVTIPSVTGVVYSIDGEDVTGSVVITDDVVVHARPAAGYRFPENTDDDWYIQFA